MRKLKPACILFLLIISTGMGFAQQNQKREDWAFQSINNMGLLVGQTGPAFQLQSINGARYKSWFAGLGVGLDDYRFRTIPLFVDLRKDFGHSHHSIFAYADGGISISWVTNQEKMAYTHEDFSNGFYDDIGIGYKIVLGKNALQCSLGYSNKKIADTYSSPFYNVDLPPVLAPQTIHYSLNRVSIKLGWSF